MDYNSDGFIVKSDINKFLCANGVFKPVDLDLEGLMKKLDTKKRGKFDFNEFSEEFMSKLPHSYQL